MKKNLLKLAFVAAFSVVSCTSPKKNEVVIKNLISGDIATTIFFGLPYQMCMTDSFLFVNDFYGDTLIHCLDANNFKEIAKLGVKGAGPHEMMPPLHLFMMRGRLCLFSRRTWTLYDCSLDSLKDNKPNKLFTVPTEVSLVFPLSDSTYLCSGMFPEHRYTVLNKNGEQLHAFGSYPSYWKKETTLPVDVKRMFHQVYGYVRLSPNEFLIASSHILTFFMYKEEQISVKKEICLAPYEYNYTMAGMNISSQTALKPEFQKGVRSVCSFGDYIYVLFNPGTQLNKKTEEIWVFDRDGNQLSILRPKMNIMDFTVSSTGEIIALTDEVEPHLIKLYTRQE